MPTLWLINQFSNTPELPGHTRQYEIASGLVNQGWSVEVFSSDFSLSKRCFCKLNKFQLNFTERFPGIKWTWLRVLPYQSNNWKRYLNMISFCLHLFIYLVPLCLIKNSLGKGPDIILASSPQLPATFISLCIARIFKKPFVSEIRDLWPQTLIDQKPESTESFIVRFLLWMEREVYSKSDYVVVLAKGSERYVKERGAKKTIFLPNGADINKFKFSSLPDELCTFNKIRTLNILYPGAHGLCNALDKVLEAAFLLSNLPVKFVFIGDGPQKRTLIKKSKTLSNVKFLDPVPKKEMYKIMKSSDAILISLSDIPLFKYGVSPNKLYDAYALGRPVISSVGGEINKEIEDNSLGVVCPPENPVELANAVKKLLNTPREERELMGKRGRKLAETIYSRSKIISKYDRVLSNLLMN